MPTAQVAPWQYAALYSPWDHTAFYGGVATGKTYTGSHFGIKQITEHSEMSGFIGANTYDQLSQATLKEFFFWLEFYGFEFVFDKQPPKIWNCQHVLKSYKNTVIVYNPRTARCTLIFTRVLSDENPLRGIEFSWYWLDETRDTPEITHDVVLSRMRETPGFQRGIITTTTNGEDWSYRRFCVSKGRKDRYMYGALHIPTRASLEAGIISEKYYNNMLASYSPMMALQELEAKHVNILGGKAYYAASDKNRQRLSPWGDSVPSRERPIIVACDFNFSPAPLVWMIGQVGPMLSGASGEDFSQMIHWFDELSGVEVSTQEMTTRVMLRYPDFFYRVYGDLSGGQGTTSNAGVTDYDQMAAVFQDAEAMFGIDYFQMDESESRQNPRVRTRVENMNARLLNGVGQVRMTYNPDTCPLFDGDMKMVGWKPATASGRGKLDDGGDNTRTHASDGAGYAVMKLFPPGQRARMIESLPSTIRQQYGLMRTT